MKLTSLNTWGGKIYKPFIEFIRQHSQDTDIFCFQEVFDTKSAIKESAGYRTNLYSEITKVLTQHIGYFVSSVDNYLSGSFQKEFTDFDLSSGLAIFANNRIKIKNPGSFFIFGQKNSFNPLDINSMPRIAQYINLELNSKNLTVLNVHGIWVREGKIDIPSRIKQSNIINTFLEKQSGEKIVCGDFNLDINTDSLKLLEKNMTNLIKKHNISTTRNMLYPGTEKFADYIFVSKEIKVLKFQVPQIEISDHLPLVLEFEL